MGSYRDKLARQVDGSLETGGNIIAAAKCLPKGASKRRAIGGD